ncbi:MAG: signal peptidase I [Propionibacteriaceae bacterium]|nr:signal peptidase I [Propionibacteriaceae bacterium]
MTEATENAQAKGESKAPRSLGRRVLGGVGEIAVIIIGALVISTLLRSFVAQMFVIPSGSMENTLQIGDRVLVSKFGGFQRGDVVVFADPGTWLPENTKESTALEQTLEFIGVLPNSGEEYLIKRVVGMPGDRVKCCTTEGEVTVNGAALEESSYLYTESGVQVAPSSVTFDVVVPKDHVFVMGDHRNSSADSRCRLEQEGPDGNQGSGAFVPTKKVVGAAVAIVAPLNRLATFQVPKAYENVPAPEDSPPEKAIIIEAPPGC